MRRPENLSGSETRSSGLARQWIYDVAKAPCPSILLKEKRKRGYRYFDDNGAVCRLCTMG